MEELSTRLQKLRNYYESGATRPYEFRAGALKKLKSVLLAHEQEIYDALYTDLKKNPEEVWVTEIGFLLAEINTALKHVKKWMKPEKVTTNLLNFPSKSYIYKEPLGVVLIIGPWNYPLQLLLAPLIGAIAGGNCCVLKPSEFAPATANVIWKLIAENFSPDHILFVPGEGAAVLPVMMNRFRFDHIFFTGSEQVGKIIYSQAAQKLIPVTLELGGKSPCVVESDANIKVAARRIAQTKFSNAGQMCVAPDYVLVHHSVKDELIVELKKTIASFYEDASANYNYGRIVNKKNFDRLAEYLRQGKILYGGRMDENKLFIEPTLLGDIPPEMAVMGEEIFGPVLPVIEFNDFNEAKKIIGKHPDPLAFYVFTGSMDKENRWLDEISFGGGCVNNASWHLTNPALPFGGRGNSGIGRYHGKYSFETFTHKKAVLKTPTWFDPNVKYPPFKGKLNLFKKIIK
jgi:aldehyde dehydrogenase (NAD+)